MNRTWTDEQEQYLVAHYATTSNAELAEALGKKNADRVMAKASLLGLKKSRQFLKESCQQRENSGKFKKGMTPQHNKGKKLSDSTKAKLAKTMFKSGNRPHNTLQVGAETQDKDGYVMVKEAEPNVWQYKHHVAYGEPVPTGHKVIFLDGNKYNFMTCWHWLPVRNMMFVLPHVWLCYFDHHIPIFVLSLSTDF